MQARRPAFHSADDDEVWQFSAVADHNIIGLHDTTLSALNQTQPIDVIAVLMNLKPPDNWQPGITKAMSAMLGEKNLDERIAEIKEIIERMDARWDH